MAAPAAQRRLLCCACVRPRWPQRPPGPLSGTGSNRDRGHARAIPAWRAEPLARVHRSEPCARWREPVRRDAHVRGFSGDRCRAIGIRRGRAMDRGRARCLRRHHRLRRAKYASTTRRPAASPVGDIPAPRLSSTYGTPASTCVTRSGRAANGRRSGHGNDSTHCRTGARSTRWQGSRLPTATRAPRAGRNGCAAGWYRSVSEFFTRTRARPTRSAGLASTREDWHREKSTG